MLRSGIGALRVCSLNSPTIVSTLTKETTAANRAVKLTLIHLRRAFLTRQARVHDLTSNTVVTINNTRQIILSIRPPYRAGFRRQHARAAYGATQIVQYVDSRGGRSPP